MDTSGLRVTQNVYFSLLTHIKLLLEVAFYDTTAEIWASFWTVEEGQTDMEVEIVI